MLVFGSNRTAWTSIASGSSVMINGNTYYVGASNRLSYAIQQHPTANVQRFNCFPGYSPIEVDGPNSTVDRAELDGGGFEFGATADVWLAYSMMLEPGPVTTHAGWCFLGQMHRHNPVVTPGTTSPFICHLAAGDIFQIRTTGGDDSGGQPPIVNRYTLNPMRRGRWYAMVHHLVFDQSGAGSLTSWINGAQVVNARGIVMGYGAGQYWKYGVYRGWRPIAEALHVQYANMECGTTDLTARITTPLMVP